MTLLKRATIKSYDAGSHRAAVGIAGSLSVWLDSLAVSDDIPAAAMVAGRECSVLFHTDDNPDDAVVVSVTGAGAPASPTTFLGLTDTPGSYAGQALKQVRVNAGETDLEFAAAGAGGTPTLIEDADQDTKIQAEESADEDVLRFDTFGTEQATLDASGRWKWNAKIGHAFGSGFPSTQYAFNYGNTDVATASRGVWLISPNHTVTSANRQFTVLEGNYFLGSAGVTVISQRGLSFGVIAYGTSGTPTFNEVSAVVGFAGSFGSGAHTVTDLTSIRAAQTFTGTGATYTRWHGLWSGIVGAAVATTIASLRIDDVTAGTNKYLMWAGPNVPSAAGVTNLRLDAGNPPNAALATEGDSQLYLTFNENGVLAMRQLRWRRQSSLGATDKVVIAQ